MNRPYHGTLRILITAGLVLLAAGCTSTSLTRPPDFNRVVDRQPSSIALGGIQDGVPCDDEAFYLQKYLEGKRIFYDCLLADNTDLHAYHGADVIVSGKIAHGGRTQRLGWGKFAAIITLGGYYFLGGPTQKQQTSITYNFEVYFADTGKSQSYLFSDAREAYFGLYGPGINMERKPELYEPGWDRLLYEICKELQSQRAGRMP